LASSFALIYALNWGLSLKVFAFSSLSYLSMRLSRSSFFGASPSSVVADVASTAESAEPLAPAVDSETT